MKEKKNACERQCSIIVLLGNPFFFGRNLHSTRFCDVQLDKQTEDVSALRDRLAESGQTGCKNGAG